MFFECCQFRSIGDHAQVVPLKIGVGNVFHGGIVVEIAGILSTLFLRGAGPLLPLISRKTGAATSERRSLPPRSEGWPGLGAPCWW
jgi:hypothetical protein